MAYRDDVSALSPDHFWRLDGDVLDSEGTADGTNTGFALTAAAACEDATNAAQCNDTADRIALTAVAPLNAASSARYIGGWIRMSAVQLPPKSLFRQGSSANQFGFVLWAGNNVMLEVVDGSSVYQAYSNRPLQPNRNYHLVGFLNGNGDFGLYLDGVLQTITNPSDRQFVGATFTPPASNYDFGDPSSGTEVGNQTVLLNGPTNANYNFWFAKMGTLTGTQVREELFEKGALPDVTIPNQAGLDALADTVRPNAPLCIRVTGNGPLTLTADNVTFDPLASIHVQFTGTGTLTWINTNGSNASIGSTTGGGTITFVESVPLTVTALEAAGLAPIAGARVRVEAAAGGPLTAGDEILGGVTDGSGQVTGSLPFSSNQPYIVKVRKGSSPPYYVAARNSGTITSTGLDTNILMVRDE